jgi:hypothetical protein
VLVAAPFVKLIDLIAFSAGAGRVRGFRHPGKRFAVYPGS